MKLIVIGGSIGLRRFRVVGFLDLVLLVLGFGLLLLLEVLLSISLNLLLFNQLMSIKLS